MTYSDLLTIVIFGNINTVNHIFSWNDIKDKIFYTVCALIQKDDCDVLLYSEVS